MLRADNAPHPQVIGVFYKVTVQAMLLSGTETWNLDPSALKHTEGFHLWAAWHMLRKRPQRELDGS